MEEEWEDDNWWQQEQLLLEEEEEVIAESEININCIKFSQSNNEMENTQCL